MPSNKNMWIKPRRLIIQGRPISLRLEPEFWYYLRQIAAECGTSATKLIAAIAIAKKPTRPLSSELRIHIAGYFRNRAPQTGFFDPDTRFALRIVDDPPSKSRREESHRSRRRPKTAAARTARAA